MGLNIAKPPDLLHLYRDYGQHMSPTVNSQDFGCMVDIEDPQSAEDIQQLNTLNEQLVCIKYHVM